MHDYGLLCFTIFIQDIEASIRDDVLVNDHPLKWLTQSILFFNENI